MQVMRPLQANARQDRPTDSALVWYALAQMAVTRTLLLRCGRAPSGSMGLAIQAPVGEVNSMFSVKTGPYCGMSTLRLLHSQ